MPLPAPLPRKLRRPPLLAVERLEDRCTPAGARVPAGEFNWTQYAPTGDLAQLVWDGQTVVYRVRSGAGWHEERVASAPTFSRAGYDTRDQVEAAAQSAQLVFTADGTPHVFLLESSYSMAAGGYQTGIAHYSRSAAGWRKVETVTPNGVSGFGPNNLVAAAGPGNSVSLLFAETDRLYVNGSNTGAGRLTYATNAGGGWAFTKIADTGDLRQDALLFGTRYAPRFFSMTVDAAGAAHVTYTPNLVVNGFSTIFSELRYATNRTGAWQTERVYAPPDGTGDAGLGASVAVAPNGQVAVASYFVDRYPTGSPFASSLLYHTRRAGGGWDTETVAAAPDGYAAGDGPKYTGFAPQLSFDAAGRPSIVFSDEAADHLPVTIANQFAGQIRSATKTAGGAWLLQTVYAQTNPLVNQMVFPVAATRNGQTAYFGLKAVSTLDGNRNPTRTDYELVEVNAPTAPVYVAPAAPPAPPPVVVSPPTSPEPLAASRPAPQPAPAPVSPPPPTAVLPPPAVPPTSYSYSFAVPATPQVAPPATPPAAAEGGFAVGTDAGRPAMVWVYRADGSLDFSFAPFSPGFTGGARVARADVTGDGIPDVIVGSGPGAPGVVQVWDGATHRMAFEVMPFDTFDGGVYVAAGDMTRDGAAEVVIVPGNGGGPRVQIRAGKTFGLQAPDFYGLSYTSFRGGLRVAVGDVNRDGAADVVLTPGLGGGPVVSVFDGATFGAGQVPAPFVADFFVFDPGLRTGLYLAVGDVDGDGYGDIIAGAGEGGSPFVRVLSGKALTTAGRFDVVADFFAGSPDDRGGARVAVTGRQAAVVAGPADGNRAAVYAAPAVRASAEPLAAVWVEPDAEWFGGVFVG